MQCALLFLIFFTSVEFVHSQDTTFIELLSGEKRYGKVERKGGLFKKDKIVLNDTLKYSLKEVNAYQNAKGFYLRIPDKNIFARRIQSGRVNLYTREVSSYTPHGSYSSSVEYFTKGNGKLQKASYGNLKKALLDNELSVKYLSEYQTLTYTQIGLVAVGLGTFLSAFIGADKDTPPSFGRIGIGSVLALSGWIPPASHGNKKIKKQ